MHGGRKGQEDTSAVAIVGVCLARSDNTKHRQGNAIVVQIPETTGIADDSLFFWPNLNVMSIVPTSFVDVLRHVYTDRFVQ